MPAVFFQLSNPVIKCRLVAAQFFDHFGDRHLARLDLLHTGNLGIPIVSLRNLKTPAIDSIVVQFMSAPQGYQIKSGQGFKALTAFGVCLIRSETFTVWFMLSFMLSIALKKKSMSTPFHRVITF